MTEERHEIGHGSEASVHQVRIDIERSYVPDSPTERAELERRLVERAEHWARTYIADRPSVSAGL